jgi:hypothetical protein
VIRFVTSASGRKRRKREISLAIKGKAWGQGFIDKRPFRQAMADQSSLAPLPTLYYINV